MIVLDWRGGLCSVESMGADLMSYSCFHTAKEPLRILTRPPPSLRDALLGFDILWPLSADDELLDYRAQRMWRGEASDR